MDERRFRPTGTPRAVLGTLAVLTVLAIGGCGQAATMGGGSRDVRMTSPHRVANGKVPQAELQEDLQRFTGQFLDRIAQATYEPIGDGPADAVSNDAMRMGLVDASSALDIATEPLPEIGVLDMAVFLRLNRATLADHWVPQVLGERGRPLLRAFEQSEPAFWPIADKILSGDQKAKLIAGIDAWRRENPDQVRVEAVRFTDFSAQAGAVAVARTKEGSGVLAGVKAATQTADQAVLLAERGLFLANRMPFLLRMQARLGAREVLGDTAQTVGQFDALAKSLHDLEPMVGQLPALIAASTEAARESRLLVKEVQPLVPTTEDMARLQHTLDATNTLLASSSTLLSEVRASTAKGPDSPIERISRRVDSTLSRALGYVIALGAAWSALWWGGYVLARRAVAGRPPGPPSAPSPEHTPEHAPEHGAGAPGRDVARGAA